MRKIGFVGFAAFIAFTGATGFLAVHAQAPAQSAQIPNLAGIWDGSGRARPVNSETVPWGKDNFPVLNERALAYQKVFDEAIAPKYDCQPATPPAIEYDPYSMEVIQMPDRVVFKYEKDDQVRTVWLDGRQPTVHDMSLQGFSVGHYENNALHRRHRSLLVRHHRIRRLQRHSLVAVEEGARTILARRSGTEGDRHRRRRDVPQKARVVHDALAAAACRATSCRRGTAIRKRRARP